MKRKIAAILAFVLLSSAGPVLAMGSMPGANPEIGKPAVDFSLTDLNGNKIKLSDHKGKVVFLNFFRTNCPACVEEMPSIQKLYDTLKWEKFKVLAVALDRDGARIVAPFMADGRYWFTVLLDSDGDVAEKYRIKWIPTTFIIDKGGKIVDKVIGPRDWADDATVKKLKELMK